MSDSPSSIQLPCAVRLRSRLLLPQSGSTVLAMLPLPRNSSSEYTFEPEASGTINRNFADVTADGQIYCYEINNRFPRETTTESHVLGIQLVDKLTLKVEKLSNASCSDGELGFSDTAVIFER